MKFLNRAVLAITILVSTSLSFVSSAKADRFDDAGRALDLALRSCLAGSLIRYSGGGGIANILRGKVEANGFFERVDVIDLIPGLGSQLKSQEADKVRACIKNERDFIFCQYYIYCRNKLTLRAEPETSNAIDKLTIALVDDISWAAGKWCGVIPRHNNDVVEFYNKNGSIVYKYHYGQFYITDNFGRNNSVGGFKEDHSDSIFYKDGKTSFFVYFDKERIESWALTFADTLQTYRVDEQLEPIEDQFSPTLEFSRC